MTVRTGKYITVFFAVMSLLLVNQVLLHAAPALQSTPKMRPYCGVGILLLAPAVNSTDDMAESPLLYEEPAFHRLGLLDASRVPKHGWIFGDLAGKIPLIVMLRRDKWLRIVYDDAGREAWLDPPGNSDLKAWEIFFKGRNVHMLSGLQKKYYQLFQQPGKRPSVSVTSRQAMKVIRVEGDWAMVLSGRNTLNWLRWRDDDGRFLVGL